MSVETLPRGVDGVDINAEMTNAPDISSLTPPQLADFHLAYAAVFSNGANGVYLSPTAHEMAEEVIDNTLFNLITASADALTKEMLPWRGGGTTSEGRVATTETIRPEVENYRAKDVYGGYIPSDVLFNIKGRPSDEGKEFVALVYGLRSYLREHANDREEVLGVALDIAKLSNAYFAETYRHDLARGKGLRDGWLNFSTVFGEYLDHYLQADRGWAIIHSNRLLGAVHNGHDESGKAVPIVTRFVNDGEPEAQAKSIKYIQVLDASWGEYEDLLPFCSIRGYIFWAYLSGKLKSLCELPADKPVPSEFTQLSA